MKFFQGLSKKKLSIDFGSSNIRIVEGDIVKGNINISNSSSIQLPSDLYEDGKIIDNTKISQVIIETFKKGKTKNSLLATAIINSSLIITREVTIPKVSENEIKSIIEFQLSEFLPIDPEDYVVNHLTMGTTQTDEVEQIRILLVAIPKGIVLSHLDLMKESDLRPEILDLQGNAIAKLLNFNTIINGDYSIIGKTIASVDIGHMSTNIAIIKDGNIEVTRTFDIGAHTIYTSLGGLFGFSTDEAEEKVRVIEDINIKNEEFDDYHRIINITRTSLESLMDNVQSIIRYYTSRSQNNKVDLILLQGGLSHMKGINDLFLEYLSLETIRLKSLDKINFNGDLSLYANAIGGLIRRDEVKK